MEKYPDLIILTAKHSHNWYRFVDEKSWSKASGYVPEKEDYLKIPVELC